MTVFYAFLGFISSLFSKNRMNIKKIEDIQFNEEFICIKTLMWFDIYEIGFINIIETERSIGRMIFIFLETMIYGFLSVQLSLSILYFLSFATFFYWIYLFFMNKFYVDIHMKHVQSIRLEYVNKEEIMQEHFKNENLKKIFSNK